MSGTINRKDYGEGLKRIGRYLLIVIFCWLVALIMVVVALIPVINEKVLSEVKGWLW